MSELKATEGTPEKCFVESALELLKKRKIELLEVKTDFHFLTDEFIELKYPKEY